MTQDEIISQNEVLEMAREAKLPYYWNENVPCHLEQLEAFAKLVAEREREACVKHLESVSNAPDMKAYADSIRARGEA